MLIELFKSINKTADPVYDDNIEDFIKIFKKYGVRILGGGTNVDNPYEVYIMTAYRDKNHMEETAEKLQKDTAYLKLAEKIKTLRESFELVTLENSYEM